MLSSLHQISHGRIGANIVTSQFDLEAQNYSMQALPHLEKRYERADEFINVMKKLWESFTVEAIVNHKDSGIGLNHQYIHPLHYQGKYFQVAGAINIPTPKYGRPRLFQAGTSIPGRDLAVRHVDAIFQLHGIYKMANNSDKTFINVPWKQIVNPLLYYQVSPFMLMRMKRMLINLSNN